MPPKKKIAALVKVQLPAGQATPAPPVGTALGPHGVNIMDFVKQYNAATEAQRGNIIPVEITIFEDRSFTFITKTPPAPELIKKALGLDKGSAVPHKDKVGKLSREQLRSIAETKMPDLNANDDRGRREDHRRHRPVHGHHRRRVRPFPTPWEGRFRPAHHKETDMQRSKAHKDAEAKIDRDKLYSPAEAAKLAKETSTTKFDATVEVALRLGVDPRKADQIVRGTVNLPHGTGKTARVLVFATGDRAEAAREAGADIVGADELIDEIAKGNRLNEFDAVVATPDLMGKVGRLGRVLGPRGLCPTPRPAP